MRPPDESTAPRSALDEAVLMNSLLEFCGILVSLCNAAFNLNLSRLLTAAG
jgi:hypothetical protein